MEVETQTGRRIQQGQQLRLVSWTWVIERRKKQIQDQTGVQIFEIDKRQSEKKTVYPQDEASARETVTYHFPRAPQHHRTHLFLGSDHNPDYKRQQIILCWNKYSIPPICAFHYIHLSLLHLYFELMLISSVLNKHYNLSVFHLTVTELHCNRRWSQQSRSSSDSCGG